MAFGAGNAGKVYLNGYDLTSYFRSMQAVETLGAYDTTVFGNATKTFIPGLADGTIALDGLFDGSSTSAEDAILAAASVAATPGVALVFPAGDAIGARGRACASIHTSYTVSAPVDGVVSTAAAIQATGGIDGVRSLHALGAETATGDAASVNHGAATTNGGVGYIEAPAFTGTSVVVKIQHSADNSIWADLITFTAISAAHAAQRVEVSGTVNQYLRASHASGTFSSVTDVVAFGRR